MESAALDESVKSRDASSVDSMSKSRSPSPEPALSLSARRTSEVLQTYGPGVWQQRFGITSDVQLPVPRSSIMLPSSNRDNTGQETFWTPCNQYILTEHTSSTESPRTLEYKSWNSLAGEDSGPFDEGYAAINQAQWRRGYFGRAR